MDGETTEGLKIARSPAERMQAQPAAHKGLGIEAYNFGSHGVPS